MQKYVDVYGEIIAINEKNAKALRTLSTKCEIEEETLAAIWGYISQAIMDANGPTDREFQYHRRYSVETIFRRYSFLLYDYRMWLPEVAEMLPELGGRAVTPENLEKELRNELG